MITQGYVLVRISGEYEDKTKDLLVFSENKEELEKIAFEENSKISKLKEQYDKTEESRLDYTNKYHKFLEENNVDRHPDEYQLQAFLEEFPIPDELTDLIFETSEYDWDSEVFYLAEVDTYDFDNYYTVYKLVGFTS